MQYFRYRFSTYLKSVLMAWLRDITLALESHLNLSCSHHTVHVTRLDTYPGTQHTHHRTLLEFLPCTFDDEDMLLPREVGFENHISATTVSSAHNIYDPFINHLSIDRLQITLYLPSLLLSLIRISYKRQAVTVLTSSIGLQSTRC